MGAVGAEDAWGGDIATAAIAALGARGKCCGATASLCFWGPPAHSTPRPCSGPKTMSSDTSYCFFTKLRSLTHFQSCDNAPLRVPVGMGGGAWRERYRFSCTDFNSSPRGSMQSHHRSRVSPCVFLYCSCGSGGWWRGGGATRLGSQKQFEERGAKRGQIT